MKLNKKIIAPLAVLLVAPALLLACNGTNNGQSQKEDESKTVDINVTFVHATGVTQLVTLKESNALLNGEGADLEIDFPNSDSSKSGSISKADVTKAYTVFCNPHDMVVAVGLDDYGPLPGGMNYSDFDNGAITDEITCTKTSDDVTINISVDAFKDEIISHNHNDSLDIICSIEIGGGIF